MNSIQRRSMGGLVFAPSRPTVCRGWRVKEIATHLLIEGEPLPLEGRLADAIDPARFLLRGLRRASAP